MAIVASLPVSFCTRVKDSYMTIMQLGLEIPFLPESRKLLMFHQMVLAQFSVGYINIPHCGGFIVLKFPTMRYTL